MSEVTSRTSASRGRGSGRGGRGGFAGRGGRRPNGDKADHKADDSLAAFEDEGDFGELRKQYGDKTSVIREMFPDWSEADVLFALQETNGDENEAVTRIAEGMCGLFSCPALSSPHAATLHIHKLLEDVARPTLSPLNPPHMLILLLTCDRYRYHLAMGRGLKAQEGFPSQGQGASSCAFERRDVYRSSSRPRRPCCIRGTRPRSSYGSRGSQHSWPICPCCSYQRRSSQGEPAIVHSHRGVICLGQ